MSYMTFALNTFMNYLVKIARSWGTNQMTNIEQTQTEIALIRASLLTLHESSWELMQMLHELNDRLMDMKYEGETWKQIGQPWTVKA